MNEPKLILMTGDSLISSPIKDGDCHCPVCGYRGQFLAHPRRGRPNACCGNCGARERHRMMALYFSGAGQAVIAGSRILHVSPEDILARFFKQSKKYVTADLTDTSADIILDIAATNLQDGVFDLVICSHVLEHVVDDAAAIAEMYRILSPGGTAVVCVPVIQGWFDTYENSAITNPVDRLAHFGHIDHVRYYGRDIVERLAAPGFEVMEFQASPEQCVIHATHRGSSLYLAYKK